MGNIKGAHVVFHRLLKTQSSPVCAVLLYKRTQDAPVHPGLWGLIGGNLDNGETPEEAALREVDEELGILLCKDALKDLCDVTFKQNEDAVTVRYYVAPLNRYMNELTLRYNCDAGKVEGEGLGWFTAEEIHHMCLRPEDKTAVERFFLNTRCKD